MTETSGILAKIVARKRVDVAARLGGFGLEAAEPTRRSLKAALARPGARFIMEVKRGSPSGGAIRPGADAAALARAYRGAADAISVLTDGPFFGGSLEDLEAVRREFLGPILAKDFIVDPRQVAEARLHGADAVLVILAVLGDEEAEAVMAAARRLGMDVLVEAHTAGEVGRAVRLGADIIGINNRDLDTMTIDLRTTERLAALVPAGTVVVAESGISTRADVERLAPFADAFLVGSSLMRSDDPGEAARALAFGRVKVCGITDGHDAAMAADHGAAYAGVVMVPNTPRAVTCSQAEAIAEMSPIPLVGVYRNEKPMQVAFGARALGLRAVQLHGEEDALYIRALRGLLPQETEIWAAAAVGREVPRPRLGSDRTLFDSQVAGRSGGTGIAFDWARLDHRADLGRSVLAGGLRPSNARAAAQVGAFALDVGSGVEMAPGRKDAGRLFAFFEALRPAARGEASCG
ncbi:MAG: indole-3-glycerol phosphate synthase / phosphoribosylanthranilate isomerase [Sphingomonadales bacterium]|jgi:indole-3-glycerol phosphate synthase/phosphoribosylanthranilate isomerase|nr:indole-3-glycerol phosphate synthase / phosphoribosylanthranilate isomerase [Sphingomonadales bacterium]